MGGGDAGVDHVPLVELQLHLAGDGLLSLRHEGAEGLPQGAEPQAVVDQLRKAHAQFLLLVGGELI